MNPKLVFVAERSLLFLLGASNEEEFEHYS